LNIRPEDGDQYTSVLKKHTESERLARLSSKSAVCSEEMREENQKVILVYPFVGGDRIEMAAKGLKLTLFDEKMLSLEELTLQQEASMGRAHFLTITREDRDRLEPGEFLSDTLVDFWMRWYVCTC
jgi:Ulp1 family protease